MSQSEKRKLKTLLTTLALVVINQASILKNDETTTVSTEHGALRTNTYHQCNFSYCFTHLIRALIALFQWS